MEAFPLRLRRVKIEKRVLADQGNTLVDLCKVREASERIVSYVSYVSSVSTQHRGILTLCLFLL